jgi:hypothetical protein
MGYTIIYDKRFIRIPGIDGGEDRFLPLVLSGDNNVWTSGTNGRDRRCREWNLLGTHRKDTALTATEIRERYSECIPSKYGEHFMYGGKWVDDAAYARFFESGIKNAITIEEYAAGYCYEVSKYFRHPVESVSVRLCQWVKLNSEEKSIGTAATTDELRQMLEFAANAMKNSEWENARLSVAFEYDEKLLPIERKKKKRQAAEKAYYAIQLCNSLYVTRMFKRNMSYSRQIEKARRFSSLPAAKKYYDEKIKGNFANDFVICYVQFCIGDILYKNRSEAEEAANEIGCKAKARAENVLNLRYDSIDTEALAT